MQGSIPANTQLQTSLRVVSGDENNPAYIELAVQTINDTVVRSVIIFAEGDFSHSYLYNRDNFGICYIDTAI